MRAVSSTYKQIIASGNTRNYVVTVNMTLADNTSLTITEEDIMQSSFKILTASSGTDSFDIGSAIVGKCQFTLNNYDDRWTDYDFFNATAVVWVGLVGDTNNDTQVYHRMGFFTVDEPSFAGSLVSLEMLDNMWMFDKDLPTISYPQTIGQIVNTLCTHCGVTLATQTFNGSSYTITKAPEDEMNCRELLQYVAMIGCNFCVMNDQGGLVVRWYDTLTIPADELNGGTFSTNTTPYSDGDSADGGNFTNPNSGDDYDGGSFVENTDIAYFTRLFERKIGTDDIEITGVKIKINDTDYIRGTEGYVIVLDNPLVTDTNVSAVLNMIWTRLQGFTFRTFNLTALPDLAPQVGDCVAVSYKGNYVYSYLTNYTFAPTLTTASLGAVTPTRALSQRYSKAVQTAVEVARRRVDQEIGFYDVAAQRMNQLAINAMGGYTDYDEPSTGGRIYYLCSAPITKNSQTGLCEFPNSATVYKTTGDGFFVSRSNDVDPQTGARIWTEGYTPSTGLLVQLLTALRINCEQLYTGKLEVGGTQTGVTKPYIRVLDGTGSEVCTIDHRGIIMSMGALESDDYSYTSGHFSDDGTRFDVTNDYLRSKYFAFDENGAYINGQVEADSGKIGGATITQDAIMVIGDVELYSGTGSFQFRPTDYYFVADFKLTLHTESSCTVTLVKHESGSDTTVGTYSVTSSADVETATLDHTIGTDPDDYYEATVSGSSCDVSAKDVILAYMGEEGFLGTLRGLFYGYLKSKSGSINDLTYEGNGSFYGEDLGIIDGSQWIRLYPNPVGGVPAIRRYYYDSNNVLHNDRVVWSGENLAYQSDIQYFQNIGFGTGSPSDPSGEINPNGTLYLKNNGTKITNVYQAVNGTWLEFDGGGGGGGGSVIDYSTVEQDAGIKWIDGQKIYQKTFVISKTSYVGSGSCQIGTDADHVIKLEGYVEGYSTNGLQEQIYLQYRDTNTYFFSNQIARGSDQMLTVNYSYCLHSGYTSNITLNITVFYTKKTTQT